MRETILRTLASRAAADPEFLRQARQDLTGTLTRNGYQLTEGELRSVEELQRQTVGMSDEELARTLAGGLHGVAAALLPDLLVRVRAVRAQQDRRDPEPDASGWQVSSC